MNIAELTFTDLVPQRGHRPGKRAHPDVDVTVAIHAKKGGSPKATKNKQAEFACLVIMLRGRTLAALGWKAQEHGWIQSNPAEPSIIRLRRTSPDVGNTFQEYGTPPDSVLRISFTTSILGFSKTKDYVPSTPTEVLLILKDSVTLALPASIIVALAKGQKS